MRVAVVHDWLVTYAGAERVLEQMLAVYPAADLFSLIDFVPPAERDFLGGEESRLPSCSKSRACGSGTGAFCRSCRSP